MKFSAFLVLCVCERERERERERKTFITLLKCKTGKYNLIKFNNHL